MSLEEFQGHYQDYLDEPWGDWTVTHMIAQLSALIANVNRDPEKHPEPYTPVQFLPGEAARARCEVAEPVDEVAELQSFLKSMVRN